MNIALIFGGMSSEHEISCLSAKTVFEALDREKDVIYPIFITKDGKWRLTPGIADYSKEEIETFPAALVLPSRESFNCNILGEEEQRIHLDIAIPVLHGKYGEDGTIQGLFELAGIPYVGCGVLASGAAMDKATTKRVVDPLKIRQAKHVVVYKYELSSPETVAEKVEKKLEYPVFVKPSNAGSSVGVSQAANREELVKALQIAAEQDYKMLVEESIVGHEVECAVLGNVDVKASQVGEILAADTFYTYEAKYSNPDSQTVIADYLPKETIEEIRDDAVRIFKALDGRGLSSVDFFIEEKTGEVVFNEINTFPGFTSISMYPTLWNHEGLSTKDLIARLIELGMER